MENEKKAWQREDGSCIFCDDMGEAKVIAKGEQIVPCPHRDEPEHRRKISQ